MKNKLFIGVPIIFSVLLLAQSSVVFAAPVYIDTLADFPAYPYNTGAYANTAGDLIGCGPTTGAMIFGYFQHHFGLSDLLDNPVAGVDEGLDTAWELHSANYLKTYTLADELADPTHQNGFGSVLYIKPGLEDYASDRGHEVEVMAHASVGTDPATSWYNDYGAYGDAWTDDGIFWVFDGSDWDIDPDLFCDWAEPKLSAGIAIMLTVDSDATEDGGDHWIPCVGCDRESDIYYFYDTYSTSTQSAPIAYYEATAAAGDWAISFVRSIEYIPQATEQHDVEAVSQTVTDSEVMPGDIVDIDVTVTNNGDYTETFDLTCYYDSVEIGTILVVDLAPGETRVVTFTWDTTGVPLNGYSITAWADSGEVIAEVDEANNECTMPLKIFVIPELPLGTILASLSMFGALIGYVSFKRHRTK